MVTGVQTCALPIAASLLVSLPVVVLFIVFQRFLIEGLSAGGVKG